MPQTTGEPSVSPVGLSGRREGLHDLRGVYIQACRWGVFCCVRGACAAFGPRMNVQLRGERGPLLLKSAWLVRQGAEDSGVGQSACAMLEVASKTESLVHGMATSGICVGVLDGPEGCRNRPHWPITSCKEYRRPRNGSLVLSKVL